PRGGAALPAPDHRRRAEARRGRGGRRRPGPVPDRGPAPHRGAGAPGRVQRAGGLTGAVAKPFRFFTGPGAVSSPEKLLRAARRAEDLGYSSFVMADHFMMPMAPLVALQAVAEATSTLRLSQLVLAHGFRHPAVLAKELATLDVLSG